MGERETLSGAHVRCPMSDVRCRRSAPTGSSPSSTSPSATRARSRRRRPSRSVCRPCSPSYSISPRNTQADVRFGARKRVPLRVRAGLDHGELDAGVLRFDACHQTREAARSYGERSGREHARAGESVLRETRAMHGPRGVADDVAGNAHADAPCWRQRRPPSSRGQERDLQLGREITELARERRLGDVKLFRSTADRAGVGNGHQVTQMPQFHSRRQPSTLDPRPSVPAPAGRTQVRSEKFPGYDAVHAPSKRLTATICPT
jgi:hypothetical protein